MTISNGMSTKPNKLIASSPVVSLHTKLVTLLTLLILEGKV